MRTSSDSAPAEKGGAKEQGRVTTCSFCKRSSRAPDAGPMLEGPDDVYICRGCTKLADKIFKDFLRKEAARMRLEIEELERRLAEKGQPAAGPDSPNAANLIPRRLTTCSLCGTSSSERGGMAEGSGDVYICGVCASLAANIREQEDWNDLVLCQPCHGRFAR